MLDLEINHFAYPFGTKRECKEREQIAVKKNGFSSAVSTYVKPFYFTVKDKFSIPRIIVENFGSGVLQNKINGWDYFIRRFY